MRRVFVIAVPLTRAQNAYWMRERGVWATWACPDVTRFSTEEDAWRHICEERMPSYARPVAWNDVIVEDKEP